MVSFDNGPGAMETEPIPALAHGAEGFPAPVLGRTLEAALRFADGEDEMAVFGARLYRDNAFRSLVAECIREQLGHRGQQKLWIDLEDFIFAGNFPFHLSALIRI